MPTTATHPTIRPRPGALIWTVAVFQLLVAILTLWLFFRSLNMPVNNPDAARASEIILDVSLGTALLEIIAATGLLLLKNWARYLTLFLATVPLCITAVSLIRHKPHPW